MSIELRGERQRCLFSTLAWRKLLELAQQYGWQPEGGGLIDPQAADGGWVPGGQQVAADVAAELAESLSVALFDIPAYEVTLIKRRPLAGSASLAALASASGAQMWSPDPESEPIEFFSGRLRQQIAAVIALARAGSFWIVCQVRSTPKVALLG